MDKPARPSRTTFRRLALALLLAAWPAAAGAQDTARAPAASAPRVNLPGGTILSRPPTAATRPPETQQTPQQQAAIVPDLSGRTVDQARRLLAAAGLEVGQVAEGQGSGTPGTVVQQQPRAGSAVAPKSAVQLWLAPRAATPQEPTVTRPPVTRPPVTQALVTVPRLAGRTVEDARTTLARIDLQVGTVAEAAGTGAPGTIVRQSPRPGMPVLRGSSVQVWIVPARVAQQPRDTPAPDPMMVRVPNVVGQTVEDARETLSAARLTLGTLEEAAGTGTPGTIARQQPAAGSAMLPNSRVGVWLVPARRAIMPAIMGLPLDRAREMVRQAGLRPGEVVGSGRVIGHTFQAGESVRVGSVVNISLGVPPGSVGPVATRPDPPPPAGPQPQPQPPVQRPTPGTTPGATPTPTPGTTPATPAAPVAVDSGAVPDVRRLALAQAQAALAAAGFTAVFDTALADSVGWRVTAQQPAAGARLAPGGLVALLLDPPPAVAVAPPVQPPPATGTQGPAAPAPRAESGRKMLWIALAALLLIVAAAAGAWRMRARGSAPPIAGVSARFRTDAPARVAVEGMPFGDARLRFRMNPGRTVARVAATGPLFVSKEVTGE